jgi:hypothetical protein
LMPRCLAKHRPTPPTHTHTHHTFLLQTAMRTEPLGLDRHCRRYWWLHSEQPPSPQPPPPAAHTRRPGPGWLPPRCPAPAPAGLPPEPPTVAAPPLQPADATPAVLPQATPASCLLRTLTGAASPP